MLVVSLMAKGGVFNHDATARIKFTITVISYYVHITRLKRERKRENVRDGENLYDVLLVKCR